MSGINRIPLRFLFRIKDMDKKIKKQKWQRKLQQLLQHQRLG